MSDWDGKERRRNFRCSSHEQIAVDMGIIKEKVSNTNELVGSVIAEIKNVNDRCLTHTVDYKVFNDHIQESKKQKSIWSDRRFIVLMALFGVVQTLFFFFLKETVANGKRQGSAGIVRTDTQQER